MMNDELLSSKHKVFIYKLKDGTKTSFQLAEGEKGILPERLSCIAFTGNQCFNKAYYQINGKYKINENGLYYSMNNREVHTKIIYSKDFPQFIGYGDIDIRFKIYDLVIVYSSNRCKEDFQIHLFRGMGHPEFINEGFKYVLTRLKG